MEEINIKTLLPVGEKLKPLLSKSCISEADLKGILAERGVFIGDNSKQMSIPLMPYIITPLTTALVVWVIKKIIEKFTYDFSTISGDSRRIARKKARKMGNVVDMISSFKDITESIKK